FRCPRCTHHRRLLAGRLHVLSAGGKRLRLGQDQSQSLRLARAYARAARLEGSLRADAGRAHQAAQVSPASFNPRRLAVGGLVAMAAAIGIGRFIYTPILPPMVESLQLS